MSVRLQVICPGNTASPRFAETLEYALQGRRAHVCAGWMPEEKGAPVLFAIPLDEGGVNLEYTRMLAYLRTHPGCLAGRVGGVIVDGRGDLYTKAVGREMVLAANRAGCAFPGRPLVEATGDLRNFTVQAKNAACTLERAYRLASAGLISRVTEFAPPKRKRPRLLVLHASSHKTSNTLALWSRCRERLAADCDITEIGLRNGTLEDCAGCPYTMCLHYGEQGECFYGGVMVQAVYPAIREADAVMLLCPNYNDALPANLTAAINRLTALYRAVPFTDKALYAIVVSGYSGGDIVARQVVSALNMNKGFWLPPEFCLLETANDAGTAVALPGIDERLRAFSDRLLSQLRLN